MLSLMGTFPVLLAQYWNGKYKVYYLTSHGYIVMGVMGAYQSKHFFYELAPADIAQHFFIKHHLC